MPDSWAYLAGFGNSLMRNPCQCLVKNRQLLARIACGRSGRPCIVSGQSYEVRLVLCSRHRAKEARRYRVEIVRKMDYPQTMAGVEQYIVDWGKEIDQRWEGQKRMIASVHGSPVTNGDFLEGL